MLQLYIPYLIAVALGVDLSPDPAPEVALTLDRPEITITERTPEPQVPTGQFITATEVSPILGMTKASWVAVRLYEGQDLLYFTGLLSWRCGLWEIRYGVNGAPADQLLPMEPCHVDTAQPNAMIDVETYPIWITFDADSVQSVDVELVFDDGSTDSARFERKQILIP